MAVRGACPHASRCPRNPHALAVPCARPPHWQSRQHLFARRSRDSSRHQSTWRSARRREPTLTPARMWSMMYVQGWTVPSRIGVVTNA